MSISSTVKKIMPYCKIAGAYVLHRLSSQAVEMDDGTTLEQKVTALNSLIAQKIDDSKIVNDTLTTEEGYVLDARQGKILNDKITELNGKLLISESTPSGLDICTSIHASISGSSRKEVEFYRIGNTVYMRMNIMFSSSIPQYGKLFTLPEKYQPKINVLFSNATGVVFSINATSRDITAQHVVSANSWLQITLSYPI